ncbi:MAG: glutaminyl-tRNA synthase (glutamine-hydrolyzing) subunit B [Candidatus Yanofskybacteria bacterium RIFCSPHIGHO2_01_FULL_48_25b]|uniref:Aspartyl/glutamyl-tRNA(Asn/Gln) amidotransferase subunit B n=1 Tax=Candidatus Yanofskybacteria bacterium RIFCSPHIGHO2_01_FULL_48_25b TaxID=1802672 RepID=A0A1F8EZ62_9BACT|nr:MAG: glutaminyl-tRNA synthase (glutamine-hydrolyzing) subunit B [Candidatus Yanofskybacteria bacterium RIFCSPHIGHO2_01_FULL_48_25b]
MNRKAVIGLEIHAALNTKTKMFCDSLNDPDEKRPNQNICPICMGHPGTLPAINAEAVRKVILTGLALNCSIAEDTFFERKNYFYPDLPKGYQISQYQKPLCQEGFLEIESPSTGSGFKRIRITRIHLEEDAGRLYHAGDGSLVDYNRAGVPLMELVTEPDFENGAEVRAFAEEYQMILRYTDASDADMEKGLLRVEVNISLTNPDGTYGTKVEIKNLNSISAAAASVDFEIKRQKEILEKGDKVEAETRGWDGAKQITFSQRLKEEAHDYRYFPEPDLPPIHISASRLSEDDPFVLDEIKARLPELPQQKRERFKKQYELPDSDIEIFVADKSLGNYFEHVASELLSFDKLDHLEKPGEEHRVRLFKLAANYLITELKKHRITAGSAETKIPPESFADLIVRIFHKQVSSSGAQTIIEEMFNSGKSPEEIIKEKDLGQVSDTGELESVITRVILDNPKAAADFKAGKEASLKFLIGMVMRESKGRANPQVVEVMIRERIK